MTDVAEFLFPAPAERHGGAILRWWEGRRLAYNLVVGSAGLVTLGVFGVVSVLPWMGFDGERMGFLFAAMAYGTVANLCYFLGPIAEIGLHRLWGRTLLPAGPALYRMGLTFSVGLTLLPALVLSVVAIIATVVKVLALVA